MNTAISQLPFDKISNLIKNLDLYKNIGFKNIEIIYSKFNNVDQLINFRDKIFSFDMKIISTQSILFNSGIIDLLDVNIIDQMYKIIQKCNITQTKILILGSPNCRKHFDFIKLKNNFKEIDKILIEYDKILCIEPNCKLYNGKYFFRIDEIVNFILDCDLKNVKTMIDTHNILYENLDLVNTFSMYKNYIYHIHVSENNLTQFIRSDKHIEFSKHLTKNNYSKCITYETKDFNNINASAKKFMKDYGN